MVHNNTFGFHDVNIYLVNLCYLDMSTLSLGIARLHIVLDADLCMSPSFIIRILRPLSYVLPLKHCFNVVKQIG